MAKKRRTYIDRNSVREPDMSAYEKTQPSPAKKLPYWKLLLFSLLPLFLLLLSAEVIVRTTGLRQSILHTVPFYEEVIGMIAHDSDLFWSLRPNLDITFEGKRVTTNSLGLRSGEPRAKRENEFRILSLGESSTFGVGVTNEQTYTSLLPEMLQKQVPSRTFTAFNCGVPAWSSFQSLKYLELRGLKLHPDLVLFYHELNDYLPSTVRDSSNTEIGAQKTDRQLYESETRSAGRSLLNSSALFRFLRNLYTYWSLKTASRKNIDNPLLTIGLPDIGIPGRLIRVKNEKWSEVNLSEKSFGQRVSEKERLQILSELVDLCKNNHIALVIIHPSYSSSKRHECLLTRFCRERGVLMYEAFDTLHPKDHDALYRDSWHPDEEGHRRLAEGLTAFLMDNIFVKAAN